MPPCRSSVPWPSWFQHFCTSPLPKPSHSPVQCHVLPSFAMPYSRPASDVNALKVEAAGYVPEMARLFRG